ncbi:uncharacterized protein LOC114310994 [Camellia sinensis]|uniref:uncharacterized protein LOC114310994 n=1 Tax=Camellia sinensis TaxID=4442 RepID=UPI0010362CD6|nr:uncharacterized protein LOC114310994 [Camellia sinensis]
MGPPNTRRRDKRCEYHKDHGHDTDSCYALKDHLEELEQDDQLAQHVRKNNPSNTVALRPDSPPLDVIHMIYSLPSSAEVHAIQLQPSLHNPITPAKLPHETERISFDDTDLVGVTLPHADLLVVELRVNRFTVERVLINQGGTSEIMYYKTFVKLGFTNSDLLSTDYPLFGFNANPESQLGRTWLHTIQAVPNTYHQLLCFPIEYGIEQIWDSQKSTQACYLVTAAKRPKELEVNLIEVPDRGASRTLGKSPAKRQLKTWIGSKSMGILTSSS